MGADGEVAAVGEQTLRSSVEEIQDISHDIRTPLTSILGYAELLIDQLHEAADAVPRDMAERIHANAERLHAVITELSTALDERVADHVHRSPPP